MAEKSDQPLSVNTPDAGAAFRFEMFLQNVVLGYWWVVAIAIGAMLAAVAVWGFVDSSHNSAQRTTSAETAAVFSRVERQLLDHEKIDEYTKQSGLTVRVVPSWDGIRAGQRIRLDMACVTARAEFP